MPASADVGFGALLRSYRITANMTQEQLAERSGLSVQAIGLLERGARRAPRPSTVDGLARGLGLDAARRQALVAAARAEPGPADLVAVASRVVARTPEPGAGIPPDLSPHFTDRSDELAELGAKVDRTGRVAVHGLGGVGKTQLVLRHLHTRRSEYPDGTFWLRADQEASLVGDLASLAWRLDLPEREATEHERQVEAVLRWMREHGRWLLVLDNVEPPVMNAVRHWLPPGLPGHVVLTSRRAVWSTQVRLDPLPAAIARRFLLERTGHTDADAADAVAAALGGLPLALVQAAAYVEASGRDLASYARLVETRLVELMAEGKPEGYPRPLATTWELSFERLEGERPAAADLLRLCAFVAPEGLPVSVLRDHADVLPASLRDALADDLELDRTIGALRLYSLVERQGDGLRVHRLVQAVVRDSLSVGRWDVWLGAAIRLLEAAFPRQPERDTSYWPLCARLLPHALAVDDLARTRVVEPLALTGLLIEAGEYLRIRDELGSARRLYERALAVREQTLGPAHPDVATSLNDLAGLLREQGHDAQARPMHERALAIRERTLEPDDPEIGSSHNNLGWLLRQQGDLEGARSHLERAAAIWERSLGPDHRRTATSLNNLALVLLEQGDLEAGGPLFERALAIRERALGADHPLTAQSRRNLGSWLRARGDPAAARRVIEEAIAITTRTLGPESLETGRSQHRLAMVLRDQGELAEAVRMAEQAHATMRDRRGAGHFETVGARRLMEELRAELERRPEPA